MAYTMKLGFEDLPIIYNIHLPVGSRMPNQRDDVLLVQTLMKLANFVRSTPALGPVEASRDITIDGYFGQQTERMIKAFEADQKSAGKLFVADGVFEPSSKDGYTGKGILYKVVHLNRKAKVSSGWKFDALPFDPETHAILRGSLARGATRPSWMK
jgi:peptidoglycan hydrolase-like protein with peptidoglycan-binding domain